MAAQQRAWPSGLGTPTKANALVHTGMSKKMKTKTIALKSYLNGSYHSYITCQQVWKYSGGELILPLGNDEKHLHDNEGLPPHVPSHHPQAWGLGQAPGCYQGGRQEAVEMQHEANPIRAQKPRNAAPQPHWRKVQNAQCAGSENL